MQACLWHDPLQEGLENCEGPQRMSNMPAASLPHGQVQEGVENRERSQRLSHMPASTLPYDQMQERLQNCQGSQWMSHLLVQGTNATEAEVQAWLPSRQAW
jgi:hypothetical protein